MADMELSLKEAVEIMQEDGLWDSKKNKEAMGIILTFCQSALECEGMPEKKEIPVGFAHLAQYDRENVWNECCDFHQAWAAKMLDVERIARIIASVDLVSAEMWDMSQDTRLFYMQKANAIVAGLKEGK